MRSDADDQSERDEFDEEYVEAGVITWDSKDSRRDPLWTDSVAPTSSRKSGTYRCTVLNRALFVDNGVNETVANCRLEIENGQNVSVSTNEFGNVTIDLSPLTDGNYAFTAKADITSNLYAGPGFPADPLVPRIWRILSTEIQIREGEIVSVASPQLLITDRHIVVKLQPCWLRTKGLSKPAAPPTMIIVHHTSTLNLAGDLRHLLDSKQASADYLVDQGGTLYKLAPDHLYTWHAGATYWHGKEGVNGRSIGIEILHATGAEYPNAQVDTVIELIDRLLSAFPSIDRSMVIGHSDVAVTKKEFRPPMKHGRKSSDPGSAFVWELLEQKEIGLIPHEKDISDQMYAGFFSRYPTTSLSQGDKDQGHVYGGIPRDNVHGNVVRELQEDLQSIGYRCPPDGDFGRITQRALLVFQEHLYSGSRRRGPDPWNSGDGKCDKMTAHMLKRVAGDEDPTLFA